jgi:hypothetical protein
MSSLRKFIDENDFTYISLYMTLTSEPYFIKFITSKKYKDLVLLNFTKKSDLSLDIVKQCTGCILNKNTLKILHYTFEKTCEYTFDQSNSKYIISNKKHIDFPIYIDKDYISNDNVKVGLYMTGYTFKVFYHYDDNKWIVLLSNLLDNNIIAYYQYNIDNTIIKHSYFSLFYKAFKNTYKTFNITHPNEIYSLLNKEYCYTYIIPHNKKNIFLDINELYIIELNKVHLETLVEYINNDYILNNKDMIFNPSNIYYNYIIYEKINTSNNASSNYKRLRLINIEDKHLTDEILLKYISGINSITNKQIKGNEFVNITNYGLKNIKKFYLKAYKEDKNCFNIDSKLDIYFKNIDIALSKMVIVLYRYYIDVFVIKSLNIDDIPLNLKKIIYTIHNYYKDNLKNKKLSILKKDVEYIVKNLPIASLTRLIV